MDPLKSDIKKKIMSFNRSFGMFFFFSYVITYLTSSSSTDVVCQWRHICRKKLPLEQNVSRGICTPLDLVGTAETGVGNVIWAAHCFHIPSSRPSPWRGYSSLTTKWLNFWPNKALLLSHEINGWLLNLRIHTLDKHMSFEETF